MENEDDAISPTLGPTRIGRRGEWEQTQAAEPSDETTRAEVSQPLADLESTRSSGGPSRGAADSGKTQAAAPRGASETITPAAFLEGLASLGSLSGEELEALKKEIEWNPPQDTGSLRTIADGLVGRGTLTAFQADALLTGRAKKLILGQYILVGKLGQGGMGVVYDAYDRERKTVVALKVLPDVDPASLYRFKREFRAHADLSHPNLIKLYELFSWDGHWFFTMERVQGIHFSQALRAAANEQAALRETLLEDGPSPPPSDDPLTVDGPRSGPHARSALGDDRARQVVDLDKARDLFRQLALGLLAIHGAGLLHRDIKPSNVLVRPDGRVVILDFGLVGDLENEADEDVPGEQPKTARAHAGERLPGVTDQGVVGTIDYMSPEQAKGQALTAASDWYSVGVMLFEALVGRKPFTGKAMQILKDKQRFNAPAPIECQSEVPADLNDLCKALLARRPEERPGGAEVVDRLAPGGRPEARGAERKPRQRATPVFVGRERHLAQLAEAYERARAGRATTAFVCGPSGVGKSSLVGQFLRARPKTDGAVILSGRCFEQESVPFKAIDSLVDSLARFLRRLPHSQVSELLPESVGALARVFPILNRVEAIALTRQDPLEIHDRQELRSRAFSGFRELLGRLAARHMLVLAIDDLQWGDVDSAQLLNEILLPPNPPPLFLLAVYRSDFEETSQCLRVLKSAVRSGDSGCLLHELRLEPLCDPEARDLAASVLDSEEQTSPLIDAIVREARGNPYFVLELARQLQNDQGPLLAAAGGGRINLEGILRARIERLPEQARQLLEVVALAGQPLAQRSAYQAAGLEGDAWSALMTLRDEKLTRSSGLRLDDEVETFHDRIREMVVSRMPPARRQDHHLRLARALEESGSADAETLAAHFLGADEIETAGRYYERAADLAAEALAFDRAAKLFDLARELRPLEGSSARTFQRKHAQALASAGRCAEAGAAFRALAAQTEGPEAIELRKRAAYQFSISGHIDEGRAIWADLLGTHALELPRSPRRAFLALLSEFALVQLQGLRFQERDPASIPPVDLERIDLLWSAGIGMGMIDPVPSHVFQLKSLRLALRAGDRERIARALAVYATILAYQGSAMTGRIDHLLELSGRLARQCADPYTLAIHHLMGSLADFHLLRLNAGLARIEQAGAIFARECQGVIWELHTCNLVHLWIKVFLGDYEWAERVWESRRVSALERGDLYAQFTLEIVIGSFVRLNRDAPLEARRELQAALGQWSSDRFQIQHLSALEAETRIDRYLGDGQAALDRLAGQWKTLTRSLVFRSQLTRIAFLISRGISAVLAARTAADPRPHLALARRDARRLRGERWPYAEGYAAVMVGAAAYLEGKTESGIAHYTRALALFETTEMPQLAAAAKRTLGELTGGDRGGALVAEADLMFQTLRVKDPIRTTCMMMGS
jgi:eukaryotic-like serine/threonine-protein kinase